MFCVTQLLSLPFLESDWVQIGIHWHSHCGALLGHDHPAQPAEYMNQGGCESQKNMAVDQKQYPDEAVGTRNTCKIKERRGGNQTKPRTDKVLLMAGLWDTTEVIEMHVIYILN